MDSRNGGARERHGFHLFTYGTLRPRGSAAGLLDGCERVAEASVTGTLYDIDGRYPALMLYGRDRVQGEVWWCPVDALQRLDAYEDVDGGLFRRVGVNVNLNVNVQVDVHTNVQVETFPCWTYVAGPALARELTPARRLAGGDWLTREAQP